MSKFIFLFWAILCFPTLLFGQQLINTENIYHEKYKLRQTIDSAFVVANNEDFSLGKEIMLSALNCAFYSEYKDITAYSYYSISILHYEHHKIDSAQAYMDKFWDYPKKIGDLDLLLLAHILQAKLATALQNPTASQESLAQISLLITKINNTEAEESQKKLNQITQLSSKNYNQQQSKNFNQLTTVLGIIIILILSLLTLSFFKNNNIRRKTNELLLTKNSQLLQEKEKAEEAILTKNKFLSRITHELRTPIYSVTGLTYLLFQTSPNSEQKDYLRSLQFSGKHLLTLINNILDFNKLEANKFNIVSTRFDLELEIQNTIGSLSKFALDKNNSIYLEIEKEIPKIIKGDYPKLSQVLINLLNNAIKFTKNGKIWIRVKKHKEFKHKLVLLFEVEDTGIGIPKEKQKEIFKSFIQGLESPHERYVGSGLGLSIVKGIVKAMGGNITVESALGKGSTFVFTLNFEKPIDNSLESDDNSVESKDELSQWQATLKDKTILIVEDNKINQMITHKILTKQGAVILLANDGEAALKEHKKNKFDLILMDINMPGISGIEATRIIRIDDKKTPIIALTALSLDKETQSLMKKGFDDVITKPYENKVFFKKIALQLSK